MACSARVLTRSSGVMVDQDSAMGIRLLTTLNRAPRAYPAGEDAIIGISERFGRDPIVAYDREKCIQVLIDRDGMTYQEAEEYFNFNVIGGWAGDGTPEFITLYPG